MELTYWHKLAYLYKQEEIQFAEIVRTMLFNTAIGIVEDDLSMLSVGINVLDNSVINKLMVFGIIRQLKPNQRISYKAIGDMLQLHSQTVGKGVNLLAEEGCISREDYGSAGSTYTVLSEPQLPKWIQYFTEALVELDNNEELAAQVADECKNIHFRRGFEILKSELREKFYRPRKKDNKDDSTD